MSEASEKNAPPCTTPVLNAKLLNMAILGKGPTPEISVPQIAITLGITTLNAPLVVSLVLQNEDVEFLAKACEKAIVEHKRQEQKTKQQKESN